MEPAFDAFQARVFDGGAQEAATEPWDLASTYRRSSDLICLNVYSAFSLSFWERIAETVERRVGLSRCLRSILVDRAARRHELC